MAKVSRRLSILIHPDIDGPEFEKMREQGHTVDIMLPSYEGYDRIYGPNCYRMFGPLLKFLPVSIKDARMEKYGAPTKAEPTEKKPRKSRKKKDEPIEGWDVVERDKEDTAKDECVEGVPGSDEGGNSNAEEVAGGLGGLQGTVRF